MRTRGLIAAAGRSSRMGAPKALVVVDGEALVVRLAHTFIDAGLEPVVVTVPVGAVGDDIARALAGLSVVVCVNAYDDEGLFGSVHTVLDVADDDDMLVVTPVDAPFATMPLVRALVGALDAAHDAAVPVADRMRGHPVAIRVAALRAHLAIGREEGLWRILAALGDRVADVPWDDARVTLNINTPDELARVTTTKQQGR